MEIHLFEACLQWARAECIRSSIKNPSLKQIRQNFGDELFKVRIPTMSEPDFLRGPILSGILEHSPFEDLIDFYNASNKFHSVQFYQFFWLHHEPVQ